LKREITQTPESAVQGGRVNYGWFKTPFTDLNLLDCDNWGWQGRSPRALRAFRLKEWQHFAVIHEEAYVSIALVDAKFTANAWVCVFDRRSGKSIEHSRVAPLKRLEIPNELWDARFAFEAKGFRIAVHNHLDAQLHEIDIDIAGAGDLPAIRGNIRLTEDPAVTQPMITLLPIGPGRPFYTHKAPCPVSGEIAVGDRTINYSSERDLTLIDIHKAFYPRKTFWNWATFAGRDSSGRIIGVNLTRNVIDDERFGTENGIWCDNRLSLVGPARFDVPADAREPWKIRSLDQRVELNFVPEGLRSERINMVLARSRYVQPFGRFTGHLVDDHDERHVIDGVFGVAEDHHVLW